MLSISDTLSGEKRELTPLAPDGVLRLYVCGVTPYSESHVGHALHAIVFDVLRRYLDWRGIPVKHVQNFTDIDDKLIERSAASARRCSNSPKRTSRPITPSSRR